VKVCSAGEGTFCPQHFRCYVQGKKFVTSNVEVLEGKVLHANKLLRDDCRFAVMGKDDGLEYWHDFDLANVENVIKIKFKEQ
jgi:hypothetical protein